MFVEDQIEIHAPASLVWDVTIDVEAWPDWTPTVESVSRIDKGTFGPGSKVMLKQPGQPVAEWIVTDFEQAKRFVWESNRFGLRFRASHSIESDGHVTVCTLRLEATGILAVILSPFLRHAVARALRAENHGLKARCEEAMDVE